jgi:hypothetical protein
MQYFNVVLYSVMPPGPAATEGDNSVTDPQCSAVQCSAVQCSAVSPLPSCSLGHFGDSDYDYYIAAVQLRPMQYSAVQCSAAKGSM